MPLTLFWLYAALRYGSRYVTHHAEVHLSYWTNAKYYKNLSLFTMDFYTPSTSVTEYPGPRQLRKPGRGICYTRIANRCHDGRTCLDVLAWDRSSASLGSRKSMGGGTVKFYHSTWKLRQAGEDRRPRRTAGERVTKGCRWRGQSQLIGKAKESQINGWLG